jgi:uncharacterized protein YjbI with pentapeptide repeats
MTGSDYDDDPAVFWLPVGDRSLVRSIHEGRNFMFAVLRHVDMSEAAFYWASFQYAVLEGAIMVRCDLRGAFFDKADMRRADLRHANLGLDNIGGITNLRGVDLSGADLRNACLEGADLTGAKLVGADLRGVSAVCHVPGKQTCLYGADLSEARLADGDLKTALYDMETRFPRGFDPQKAGMVARRRTKPRRA